MVCHGVYDDGTKLKVRPFFDFHKMKMPLLNHEKVLSKSRSDFGSEFDPNYNFHCSLIIGYPGHVI